ncbi:hypothetical protein BAU15_13785 [Enterococcus sp. JM4C]|uniref:DUF2922 domain-containing protein n=1 Tax=Candidatus Enterococcus huntleyi TaxID=1857217 RepID=UPI001379874F|nr:DUF2922 domain-containing protein [Enterococcus sp. JM4C]KAF1298343.1 hypothetical protein BAU15_13785 [Enterococcus sp. JM4C]
MKQLHLSFSNSIGGKHTFKPLLSNGDLTGEEVHAKMDEFKKLTIFQKDGILLFQDSLSAKYVITTEDELF